MVDAVPQNPCLAVAAGFFGAQPIPLPVVNLCNNAGVFRLTPELLSTALAEGATFTIPGWQPSTYQVRENPADWAFALVDTANADLSSRVRNGCRLLAREISPLEYDSGLRSSVKRTASAFQVGAETFATEAEAIEYAGRWADAIRIDDMIPRAFDPDITRGDSYNNGAGYIQHDSASLVAFEEAARASFVAHLGEESARFFMSSRFGVRSQRAQAAYPLSRLAARRANIDRETLREWSFGTARGRRRSARRDAEWPAVIRGGYLFIDGHRVESTEELHAFLNAFGG